MLCRAQQPLDGNDWGQRNGVAVICFKSRARERSQIKGKRSRRRAPDIWEATGKKGQQVTPMIKSYIFFAFLDSASFSSTSMRQPLPWQCNSLTISIHSSIFLFSLCDHDLIAPAMQDDERQSRDARYARGTAPFHCWRHLLGDVFDWSHRSIRRKDLVCFRLYFPIPSFNSPRGLFRGIQRQHSPIKSSLVVTRLIPSRCVA